MGHGCHENDYKFLIPSWKCCNNVNIRGRAKVLVNDSAFELDPTEIARQNQITQQILTHYIERRLFPFSNVKQKVPSIAEILPKAITSTTSPRAISIATSPTYKRGLASSNNTRRKTYGQKLKNSTRRKYNTNKIETHDKEEQEIEKRPSQERLTENLSEEEDATEQPATITHSNKYKNQDNHTFYYNNEWSGGRGFLLPYDIEDDVEHDVQEALQSVESEQYDQYYNNDIFQRDPKENEIDGGGAKTLSIGKYWEVAVTYRNLVSPFVDNELGLSRDGFNSGSNR
uniref:Uncharacterized protein n=1 Tax=Glossina austeni TaxID=7395 RepID=A0A1A9VDU9_GLOAU